MYVRAIPLALIVCGGSTGLAEPISYRSQNRFVEVWASVAGEPFSDRVDAVEFSEFDVRLDRSFSNMEGAASGRAGQQSTLSAGEMSASGTASGTTGPPVGTSGGSGNSSFSVDFSIGQASPYTLDLDLSSEFGSYSLVGPGLHFVDPNANFFQPVSLHDEGMLPPGSYSFDIFISTGAAAEGMLGTYDLRFVVVPEPDSMLWLWPIMLLLLPYRRTTLLRPRIA